MIRYIERSAQINFIIELTSLYTRPRLIRKALGNGSVLPELST